MDVENTLVNLSLWRDAITPAPSSSVGHAAYGLNVARKAHLKRSSWIDSVKLTPIMADIVL
jgi:hypothetical protein